MPKAWQERSTGRLTCSGIISHPCVLSSRHPPALEQLRACVSQRNKYGEKITSMYLRAGALPLSQQLSTRPRSVFPSRPPVLGPSFVKPGLKTDDLS
ncbi:hypothetical protein RRG08_055549 [Elysia crispata]|uniref:Uncharacterized protein n=1 Tax=Elysia crispata TaxID=231223 RepID=A0AAE1ADT0_9GAST|nr:hypothetical protein RRG08_055549 [Elysia crispata]